MSVNQCNAVHGETHKAASALNSMIGGGLGVELRGLLCQAAGGRPDVPPGWTRVQRDAALMLRSATCNVPVRAELRVTGLYVLAPRPFVQLSSPDRIVHGILRRTVARARRTCQVCGREGRVWADLSQFRVLCPRCAAPHTIAADLDALDQIRAQRRRSNDDIPVADIPPRLVAGINAALATAVDTSETMDDARCKRPNRKSITHEEFDRWCDWLHALRHSSQFEEVLASVS